MIHVIQLMDDGLLGKKGDLLYFVENTDGMINHALDFLWWKSGSIGKFFYKVIWFVITRTFKILGKHDKATNEDLGF